MTRHILKQATCILATLAVFAAPALSAEEHDAQHQAVDGLEVYLGIVPAAIILGYQSGHPERSMHGGVPRGSNQYHVMVAVFEAATGERITGAAVKARVEDRAHAGEEKALEVMTVAGAATYGNYFTLAGKVPYRISVRIQRPGASATSVARFEYRRP